MISVDWLSGNEHDTVFKMSEYLTHVYAFNQTGTSSLMLQHSFPMISLSVIDEQITYI
mgnify:CR=1 FL=1